MDIPTAPAKPLFLLTAVLYAGMGVVLLTQGEGEPPAQPQPAAVAAMINSLPATAAGPAHTPPAVSAPSPDAARRECQPLVAR
jgi:hypothetical protein